MLSFIDCVNKIFIFVWRIRVPPPLALCWSRQMERGQGTLDPQSEDKLVFLEGKVG